MDELIDYIEKILLELGKGFIYVGKEKPRHRPFYVGMVFYNQRRKYYETWF